MTRWWSQFVADTADWYPLGVFGLLLTLLALATLAAIFSNGTGWMDRWRATRPVKVKRVKSAPVEVGDDEVPELPSDELRDRARAYMGAGEHALAVREWLRATVRELIDRGVVQHVPGWTVTELAAAAAAALPEAEAAMGEAAGVFSDIWYGQRPAQEGHARRMAEIDGQVSAAIGARFAGSAA